MLFAYNEYFYECYGCKRTFSRIPLLKNKELMEIMDNFICSKCKRCHYCCKKMHKCSFKKPRKPRSKLVKKKKKTPPKRPPTGYVLFSKEKRAEIIQQKIKLNPKPRESTKFIASQWRALSDEEKAKYQERAKTARESFKKATETKT